MSGMKKREGLKRAGLGAIGAALAAAAMLLGCGTPGPPQPPSLNLPIPVKDLTAERNGKEVTLHWTTSKRTTDKLAINGPVPVQVCRSGHAEKCQQVGDLMLEPGAAATFAEALPAELTAGSPRLVQYFVELKNRKGRSAGLSNAASVMAGEAPAAVNGLVAEVRRGGVILRWTALHPSDAVRIHRTLLTPHPAPAHQGLLAAQPEPVEQDLLVESDTGQALDKGIVLGNSYEYRAQRLARDQVDGQTVELASAMSEPIRVEAKDVFPPAVPKGLEAVASAAEAGQAATIDLNWEPNAELDLAGYLVYRREGVGEWKRVSGERPIGAPAFRDADVQAGHSYRYAVSAVDRSGHESARSAEAEETVPKP